MGKPTWRQWRDVQKILTFRKFRSKNIKSKKPSQTSQISETPEPSSFSFQNHGAVRLQFDRFTDRKGIERIPESESYLVIGSFPFKDRLGTGYYFKAGKLHMVELDSFEHAADEFKFHLLQNGKRSSKEISPLLKIDTEAGRITGASLSRPGTQFCANFINDMVPEPSAATEIPSSAEVTEPVMKSLVKLKHVRAATPKMSVTPQITPTANPKLLKVLPKLTAYARFLEHRKKLELLLSKRKSVYKPRRKSVYKPRRESVYKPRRKSVYKPRLKRARRR